jgi:prolyl oligopeptidase
MRRVLSVVLLSTVWAMNVPMQAAQAAASITYPQTRKTDLVENEFGTPVADPYRWLENDVRNDPEVASWSQLKTRSPTASSRPCRFATGSAHDRALRL